MNDFTALFQHRFLVFAYRYGCSMECGNICGLADWIAEETDRYTGFKILLLDFRLNGRIALYAGYGNQVHVVYRQFSQSRNLGLNENGGFGWVNAYCQIVQSYLHNVLAYLFWVVRIVGECLCVGNHEINFIKCAGILQLHTFRKRAYIMADMKASCRAVACEDNFFHKYSDSFRFINKY